MNKKEDVVPKIGVALLAYNQGRYIEDMIDSLRGQSFQDFEVILADDGSNDGYTRRKLESLNYEKITRKVIDARNLGNAKRRKQLYGYLKNEFIVDLSADDILAPRFFESTVEFLEENDDYGAVSTNIRMFESSVDGYYYEHKFDSKKAILPYMLARNQVLGSSLMRRKALMETDLSGGFLRYQDWDRWISMLERGWKIGLVDEPLFYYRQVQSSLSHSASIDDELRIRRQLLKKHKSSYKKYYDDVIINMEYAFLEMKESKDWLDGQYNWLKKENEELRKKLESCGIGDEQQKRKRSGEKKQWVKLKRVFGRH